MKATTEAGRQIEGARYFTLEGRYVYLLDVDADRWILPAMKTTAEEQAVFAQVQMHGGRVDDEQLVTDGDAFLADVVRTFNGKSVVIALDFTFDGARMSHRTISFPREERACAVLREMRATPIVSSDSEAGVTPPAGWEGWTLRG